MCVSELKNKETHDGFKKKSSILQQKRETIHCLEISDWKKEKCDKCNRLYYAIIVFALLSNKQGLINNIGEIFNKVQRPSITYDTARVLISGFIQCLRLELLLNFVTGFASVYSGLETASTIIMSHQNVQSFSKCSQQWRQNTSVTFGYIGYPCE